MFILRVESYLPDMIQFIESLAAEYEQGSLYSERKMAQHARAFFTPAMMRRVETFVPGWREMDSHADRITLVHVVTALTALLVSPEYAQASPEQQALAKWIVLLHDVAKNLAADARDHIHGFRSAVTAGIVMTRSGFVLHNRDKAAFDAWAALTRNAIRWDPTAQRYVQDNAQLPEILAGINDLFGAKTPAALIVETVLLHMSITVLKQWPQAAPLTDAEIQRYIDLELLALLRIMMNVDNDAWSFFDPATKAQYRAETGAVFDRLEGLVNAHTSAKTS